MTLLWTNRRLWVSFLLLALAALSVLAYARAMSLPLIADDYLQVYLGRTYGPITGWSGLAADPLYRSRSTSILLTWWTERIFGVSTIAFNLTSLLVHILNTWLVFAIGSWKRIGYRVSFVAAAFFAVYEGHQEAVMWYSALPELLVFFFGLVSLIVWVRYLGQGDRHGRSLYMAALFAYILGLLSKESGVALLPVLALAAWVEQRNWRWLGPLAPFALVTILDVAGIFAGSNGNQHFQDGTFSLHAPVLLVWMNSIGRLFWVFGLASILALVRWGEIRKHWQIVAPALVWIGITLVPYCFLTYMPRIPSRHTYLASAGLSLVVAAAFLALEERCWLYRRWLPGAVAAMVILCNCGYLWTRKQAQFVERAAPTEELIRYVKQVKGPVHVHCFPYNFGNAQLAVEIGAGLPSSILVMDPAPAQNVENVFCLGDRTHIPMIRPGLVARAPL